MWIKTVCKIMAISIVLLIAASGIGFGAGSIKDNSNRSSTTVSDYELRWTEEEPVLYVEPTNLDFGEMEVGEETVSKSFYVENVGGGTLEWDASCNSNWIDVYPSNGYLNEGGSKSVEVGIDTSYLEGGEHHGGSIYLSSNGGDAEVYVGVYVIAQPELYVEPTNLDFGEMEIGETDCDSFSVGNVGGGTLEWDASCNSDWIYVYPSDGYLNEGDSKNVEVGIDTSYMESGEYCEGSIYLSSNGGDAEVRVEVKINGDTPIYYRPVASFSYSPANLVINQEILPLIHLLLTILTDI